MRMLLAAGATVAAVLMLTGTGPRPARAAPAMSWWSDHFDSGQDVCESRAQNAFARDGWTDIKIGGDGGRSIYADNGRLAAIVLCLGSSLVVVVTGGDGDLAPNARDCLEYVIKD